MKKIILLTILSIIMTSCSINRECGYKVSNKTNNNVEVLKSNTKSKRLNTHLPQVVIPVVFHVSYQNENQKITIETLEKELRELNLDFQNKNDKSDLPAKFDSLVGNPNIKFILANKTENGDSTSGIIYFKSTRKNYNFRKQIFYADPIWNPEKYLNIYIGNIRNGKTRGYVNSYPWKNKKSDGIALHYGDIGNSTRLLTHETGHWLGLWHIIEGGCSDRNDGIYDTPKQKKFSKGCPTTKNECGNDCLVMNYMDYSSCRIMFTKGQVEKMHRIIIENRNKLITTANKELR